MSRFGALEPVFDEAGHAWNVDPNLIRAVALQESGGNTRARSRAGAEGLMQIIPSTQRELGITDGMDPVQSIWGAAKYLSQGLDAEKSPAGALLYYHGGPDWRQAYGPESAGYVPGVSAKLQQITARSGRQSVAPMANLPPVQKPGQAKPAQDAPDADDFLKRTGATSESAAPVPPGPAKPATSDDTSDPEEFLKRTGAVAATPPPPITVPPVAEPDAQAVAAGTGPQPLSPAAQASIASGPGLNPDKPFSTELRENLAPAPGTTYGEVLPFAKDDATGAVRLALPGGVRNLLTGLLDLAEGPATGKVTPDATNALAGIVTGGAGGRFATPSVAAGTGEAIGNRLIPAGSPALGRNEVPDFVGPQLRADAAANPPNLLPVQAVPAGEAGAAQAVPGMLPAPPRPTVTAEPLAPPGAPAPNAAGAQASTAAEALLTPQQVQAYRSTAEGTKLLEPQPVGRADPTLYVPGVSPNTAEIEQSVNTARELKALNMTAPAVSQAQKEIAAANSERRGEYFASKAGSKVDVQNAQDAAETQLKVDYPAAFTGAKAADSQPVVDAVQGVLNDPRGKQNSQLQSYVKPLLNRLVNEDGTLKISNPEELYGFREDLARMRSKASQADQPNLQHVSGELGDIIGVTDQAIEAAAPGYRQYMDNYAAAHRKIEAMQVLQDFEPKLYDSKNVMQYGRVQSMMKQLVDARASPGLNPAKSITDETMESLWRLRDDLRRSASAQELARAPGSDTAQNAWDIAKGLGKSAVGAGAHFAVGTVAPVVGNFALQVGKNAYAPYAAASQARKQTARGMSLLNPDRNRLRDYDAPP